MARYTQPVEANYAKMSPPMHSDTQEARRSPNSGVVTTEKWQTAPYTQATYLPVSGAGIRSSTSPAAYPVSYTHQDAYAYSAVPDPRARTHPLTPADALHLDRSSNGRADRPTSHSRSSSNVSPYPQPVLGGEEPVIKKKRKRADAGQLEVLNEVYNRTAFPSTEERAELAKKLDMTPRSVQIW